MVALLKTCRGGGWGLGRVTNFTRTIFGLVVTYHLQTGGTGGTGDFIEWKKGGKMVPPVPPKLVEPVEPVEPKNCFMCNQHEQTLE